jgi:hypothetical protein
LDDTATIEQDAATRGQDAVWPQVAKCTAGRGGLSPSTVRGKRFFEFRNHKE